ncbi:DNA polymerase III subunit delta [Pueribacillus theae]|uniref:DNA polymerase III subunit delta n=1 Tax=Pueribacillus theae TaxID=2171751 RepID=UPI001F0C0DB4|nr:DNA polymerase III subunit delta [Pueribacillus theae]
MGKDFPLYLLYGSERFLIDEATHEIVKSTLDEDTYDFNLAIYDMGEVAIEEAIDDAETLPFLADKRVVVIKNPLFLTSEKQKNIEHNVKKLEEYIKNPSPHSIVIFEAPYEKLDERKKIVKELKKSAKVISAVPLKGKALIEWLKKEASELHFSIDDDALKKLVLLAGTELRKLKNEMAKLALYIEEGESVTEEMIDRLVARTLEDNVFVLVDHVVNQRMEKAFQTLYDLFEQKEEPIKLVGLLARQFRIIYQVKELSRRGYSQKQMASFLKLHPYAVQQAIRQGKNFSEAECFRLIDKLAEADYQMKSGKFEKHLLLELLFAEIPDRSTG